MPMPSMSKSMVGMQILPIEQPHTDKPYSTPDKVRATIMCSLIKRFITGVGSANSTPVKHNLMRRQVIMTLASTSISALCSSRVIYIIPGNNNPVLETLYLS